MNNKISTHLILCFLIFISTIVKGQNINTFAGNGIVGFSGDGTNCAIAQLNSPSGVVFDKFGNLYIADLLNKRVRKVNTSGIITTIAGIGTSTNVGDGGLAVLAALGGPADVATDKKGNIFISDEYGHRIRKINTSGIITTIAGTGVSGYSGDGGSGTLAKIYYPLGITTDSIGNVYFADSFNNRIRKIDTMGIITTFAGIGTAGFSGDGGLAISAKMNWTWDIAFDKLGNMFVLDIQNFRIRKINPAGVITTIAGNGTYGFSGDGGPATSAQVSYGVGIIVDTLNNIYFIDGNNNRLRRINSSGIITTICGNGSASYSGDGGLANLAEFNVGGLIALDTLGNLYFGDGNNNRVRVITCPTCIITDIAKNYVNNYHVNLFPNPNNGSFKVQIDNQINSGQLILINAVGQKVYEQKIIQGTNEIQTNRLLSGLYNYILVQDNQIISSGKLTIE